MSDTQPAPRLKQRHLTMMGLGSSIGAGLFLGVGLGIQQSGTSILLSYGLAGLLVAFVMTLLAQISAARPSLGSFSTYGGQAFGNWAAFVLGWLWWFLLVMVMGAEITGAASIIGGWFGIAPWIPALIAVVIFTVINFAAVGGFGEFEFWFSVIKVAVIILFMVLGALLALGWWPDTPPVELSNFTENFLPHGIGGFAAGLLSVAFAFGGIEVITVGAAESEDPANSVKKALRAFIVRVLIFYLGSVLVIALLLPFDQIQDADTATESPFTQVLDLAHIPAASFIMEVVIVTALLSSFNAQIYGTSRGVFSMARNGNAPRIFRRTNASGSPHAAVVLSTIVAFGSVGLQMWNPPGLLEFLFNAVGGCLVVIWVWTVATYIKLRPEMVRSGELSGQGSRIIPWVLLVAFAGLVGLMVWDDNSRGQIVSVLILTALLVVLAVVLPIGKRGSGESAKAVKNEAEVS